MEYAFGGPAAIIEFEPARCDHRKAIDYADPILWPDAVLDRGAVPEDVHAVGAKGSTSQLVVKDCVRLLDSGIRHAREVPHIDRHVVIGGKEREGVITRRLVRNGHEQDALVVLCRNLPEG